MEKNGLISKLTDIINSKFVLTELAAQSPEQILIEKNDDFFLKHLKSIQHEKDITILIYAEEVILQIELMKRANSSEEINSIKKALEQIRDAKKSLEVVYNHDGYKSATDTYSARKREAGLPIDAFREFIKSHMVRLSNRLSSPLHFSEKKLLRQRKENLKAANNIYIGLQCKALGLGVSKDEGIER